MTHVVLLGDSTIDNAAYVRPGPDVARQLMAAMPRDRVTLRAVDGAVAAGVARQIEHLPSDATHLVVSVGGNDALQQVGVLDDRTNSIADALNRLTDIAAEFEANYAAMLNGVLALKLPTLVATIYNPRFSDSRMRRVGRTALMIFNDVILRAAFAHSLPIFDLRFVCNAEDDFANSIEPSLLGGAKIANAISNAVRDPSPSRLRSEVFTR